MLIDSHCHLADDAFGADLEAVVTRAHEAGVRSGLCILDPGTAAEMIAARRVAALWPELRFAIGVHPHHAGRYRDPELAASLVRDALAEHPAARAIGEIGLDYHYDFAPRGAQMAVFRRQLRLALELDLPVVIHTREAEEDTLAALAEEGRDRLRGVFHCFTGNVALAERVLALGFHLSFAGIVTFPRADAVREAAGRVPADRILTETDSPYLAPVPHRGARNEPARVADVLARLADVRGETPAALAAHVAENFTRLARPF